MNVRCFYLILLFCLFACANSSRSLGSQQSGHGCQPIVDSAWVFIQTSEYAVNTRPTLNDRAANLRLDKWLQKLSFQEMQCLLDNESVSLKTLSFIYAIRLYNDSLMARYSSLLTDKTDVELLMADGSPGKKFKLGDLLSAMSRNIKKEEEDFAKAPAVEEAVSAFIRNYSMYPGTYKPVSFPYFSMASDNTGLRNFKVHHKYEIMNNNREMVTAVSAFVVDKDIRINVIAKDSTNYGLSYPPKLGYWLKEFGRKLTASDSLKLSL